MCIEKDGEEVKKIKCVEKKKRKKNDSLK